jgi:hypothetical protein
VYCNGVASPDVDGCLLWMVALLHVAVLKSVEIAVDAEDYDG